MFSIRKLTIKRKLITIIMLTSVTAVLIAESIFMGYSIYTHRKNLMNDLTSLAEVIGNNCKVILEFDVPEDASKVLSTLDARESIIFARIYRADDSILATYQRQKDIVIDRPGYPKDSKNLYKNGFLHIFHQVHLNEKVIGTIYLQDDMRHINSVIIGYVITLIIALIIALFTAFILSSRLQIMISRPILSLAGIAESVSGNKDYSVRAIKESEDEIGKLIDSFNEMLSEIQQRDDALQESEERFKLAVKGADLGIWDWDIPTGHVIFSKRWVEMLDYTVDEIEPHYRSWEKLLHKDEVSDMQDILKRHLEGEIQVYDTEFRLKTKEGGWKWILARGTIIERDSAGNPIRSVGTHLDITDRKFAEEHMKASLKEKEVLLNEIHHRVKNNMQLIISMLRLQQLYSSDTDNKSLDEIINRVRVFADIHRKLYQNENMTKIDFVQHLKENLKNLIIAYNINNKDIELEIDIKDPILSLDEAVPCGLLMNELISNSLKHAFADHGKISISISHGPDGELKKIVYSDNGKGMEPLSEGFGTKIINALAEQLNLSVQTTVKNGTTFDFKRKESHHTVKNTGGKILYVEDELLIAMDKIEHLRKNGYSVDENIITSGEDVVKYVKGMTQKPSLIIMDIRLQGKMSGIEAAIEIRKENPLIPIIFISGYEDLNTKNELSAIPNITFLKKTSTLKEMKEVIDKFFQS